MQTQSITLRTLRETIARPAAPVPNTGLVKPEFAFSIGDQVRLGSLAASVRPTALGTLRASMRPSDAAMSAVERRAA